ncbi:hypothetical protein JZK55_04910 [Dissulfurispira thermophila]|uniref:Uncharacterized protein n=2 Tax=root TaxID=1 RepID=A0A7G1GZY6_9BACT|nr:hypothetical protein [Dissulfurispira thermophila]BCB95569.1 hypothetical protein JZK55_04910 [Dissulfurispira thermophila]
MIDQKKLMLRVKHKTDNEKLTINSQMYFISDTAVFTVNDLIKQKNSLMLAWLEGETLHMKSLYIPQNNKPIGITKIINNKEKEAIIIMLSDGMIVIISSKDPKNCTPQIIKSQTT